MISPEQEPKATQLTRKSRNKRARCVDTDPSASKGGENVSPQTPEDARKHTAHNLLDDTECSTLSVSQGQSFTAVAHEEKGIWTKYVDCGDGFENVKRRVLKLAICISTAVQRQHSDGYKLNRNQSHRLFCVERSESQILTMTTP